MDATLLRMSFSEVECEVLSGLHRHQAAVYAALKYLKEKTDDGFGHFCTYVLKMELFRELKTYPSLHEWTFDALFFHVKNIVARIQEAFKSMSIESYFVQGCQLVALEEYGEISAFGKHIERVVEHLATFEALLTLPKL